MTNQQRSMLVRIARISDEFDGYAPYGAGQWRTLRALDRMGLIEFVSWGECGDGCERAGECPHPVQIFTLSEAGFRRAEELGIECEHTVKAERAAYAIRQRLGGE